MKLLKKILLIILVIVIIVVFYNYSKLNILAGYSAKNTASSVFVAGRDLAFTDSTDNNFSPINLTSDKIDLEEKSATGSAFGLLKRKAIYRKGLGAVLITDDFDTSTPFLTPNRTTSNNPTPYPYGNGPKKILYLLILTIKNYKTPSIHYLMKPIKQELLLLFIKIKLFQKNMIQDSPKTQNF
ncbi:hypothetical protein [Tenacibaculum sp. nBUS_03]|uniref:hypothetical protein n=1 Tax=Tenacibaculum sp. nBUS_03 TaxID=3395320 RepID=UPI003EBB5967